MIRLPRRHLGLIASLAVYAALYLAASLRYDNFASLAVFLDFLEDNAAWGIIAVALTFVILSGGIDLSVGAVMSLSSLIVGVLVMDAGWPLWAAFASAIAACCLLGASMGCVIHHVGIQPFIVTLAGMFFARGLGFVIRLESFAINNRTLRDLSALAVPIGGEELHLTALVFLAAVAVGAYVSRMTSFGRRVYALGGGEEASLLMGLKVGRTKIAIYALSGLLAGLAGVVQTLYTPNVNLLGSVGVELDAIAAVVIGGTLLTGGVGSIPGTLVGVLTIALIYQVITTYEAHFSSGLTRVVTSVLLLAFVIFQRVLTRGQRRG